MLDFIMQKKKSLYLSIEAYLTFFATLVLNQNIDVQIHTHVTSRL